MIHTSFTLNYYFPRQLSQVIPCVSPTNVIIQVHRVSGVQYVSQSEEPPSYSANASTLANSKSDIVSVFRLV